MPKLLEIITPLGEGNVILTSLSGNEQLGRLPVYHLSMITHKPWLKSSDLLGKNITVGLQLPSQQELRYFNGYITQFSDAGSAISPTWVEKSKEGRTYSYEATLHPWLWFLTRSSNSRIFQNKTIPQIIDEVCKAYPFSKIDKKNLTGNYGPWENCVQYRETDFNFISRLMEYEGIYYYFDYADGSNTLVLCDSPGTHKATKHYEKIPFTENADAHVAEVDHITDWHISHEVQPGRFTLNDFDFKKPKVSLIGKAAQKHSHDLDNFEFYDYPGEYSEVGDGQQYSKIRLEELHSQYEVVSGSGAVLGIRPGSTFTLTNHPQKDQNKEYLFVGANYSITNNAHESSGGNSDFHCSFHAITATTPFRPHRATPKPIVQGPQTAIVVGPSGEEIYTDEFGRIKVQFHWDRYNNADENSSCWVRVSQPWAGKEWGGIFIPRVGHEVIIEFLEGDPDCPIVTGCVYNGDAKPPYALPANKTRSGFKTRTYKGGNSNFNEFRFEDKKGEEEIYTHAEHDQVDRVKHDRIEYIGNEEHRIIKKDVLEKIEGEHHLAITGDQNVKADGSFSFKVGQSWQTKAGQKLAVDAGTEIHLKAGNTIVIEAGTQLTLKVGGNFITIDPSGVTIQGTLVKINSGGSAGSGSGASPTPPKDPKEAHDSEGGGVTKPKKPEKPESYSPQAQTLKLAHKNGTPFCAKCEDAKKAKAAKPSS